MSTSTDDKLSKQALEALKFSLPDEVSAQQVKQIKATAKRNIRQCNERKDAIAEERVTQSQYALELISQSCDEASHASDSIDTVSEESAKLDALQMNAIHQVSAAEIMGAIPARGQALVLKAKADTSKERTHVRKNYKELRNLHKMRSRALKQLHRLNHYNDVSDQTSALIRNIEDQMRVVDVAAKLIEKKVREISHFFLLFAETSPHILIDCLIVCEIEDKHPEDRILTSTTMEWQMWREHAKVDDMDDDLDECEAPPSTDSMRSKVLFEVNEGIQEVVRDELNDDLDLNEFLKNAENIMNDIEFITNTLADVFPPHYDIVSFCVQRYLGFTIPKIASRIDPNAIPSSKILDALAWIEMKFNSTMKPMRTMLAGTNRKKVDVALEHFKQTSEELQSHFLGTTSARLKGFVDNMLQSDNEEHFAAGRPYTHSPQDLMDLLDSQFTIATSRLSGGIYVELILVIVQHLEYFASKVTSMLETNHLNLKDEYLCAWANNGNRLSEMAQERATVVLEAENKDTLLFDDRQRLDEAFDARICEFTKLSIKSVELLVDKIVADTIEKMIMPNFFTPEWASGENSPMESVIITIDDYAEDLKKWFEQPYYYVLFLVSFAKRFKFAYCFALAHRKLDLKKFHGKQEGHQVVGDQILLDMSILEKCLTKPELAAHHREDSLTQELKIFKAMSNLFSAPDDVIHCYISRFFKSCPPSLRDPIFSNFLESRCLSMLTKAKLVKKMKKYSRR